MTIVGNSGMGVLAHPRLWAFSRRCCLWRWGVLGGGWFRRIRITEAEAPLEVDMRFTRCATCSDALLAMAVVQGCAHVCARLLVRRGAGTPIEPVPLLGLSLLWPQ